MSAPKADSPNAVTGVAPQPLALTSAEAPPPRPLFVSLAMTARDWLLADSPPAALRRWFVLLLLPALVWVPTLAFDFVLDDFGTFLDDPLAQGPLSLPAILTTPVHVERSTLPFYRPVITLTYWLDRTLWGANPAGFHLTNLVLHVVTVLLAYALLRRIGAGTGGSFLAAALFAVLPSHAEAVAWIQGRVDLAAAAFFLAATFAAVSLRDAPTLRRWAGALLAFVMALLTKEPAAVLPGMLVLLWRVRGYEPWKSTAVRLGPFLVVLAAYVGLRRVVLSGTAGFALAFDQLPARGLGLAAILLEYLRITIWPGFLPNFHMAISSTGLITPTRVVVVLAVSTAFILSASAWGRRNLISGLSRSPAAVGVAWFLLTLAPALGAVWAREAPRTGYLVTERYVYLPAIGLCLAAAWGLGQLLARPGWMLGASALLIVLASTGAFARAQAWRDAETTYRAILPRTGDRALAHVNLGVLYLSGDEIPRAVVEFETVLREDPTHPAALNNLGVARSRQGRTDEALALYQKALGQRPDYADAWNNLGVLFEERGETGAARGAYQRALAIDPALTRARRNLERLGAANTGDGEQSR